jgi:hypothetical protein
MDVINMIADIIRAVLSWGFAPIILAALVVVGLGVVFVRSTAIPGVWGARRTRRKMRRDGRRQLRSALRFSRENPSR